MILQKYKIVFSGSAGAGKTVAIKLLSGFSSSLAENHENNAESHAQAFVLMGVDYGEIHLENGHVLGLYSLPSQICSEFVATEICNNALGGVILLDHSSRTPLEDLQIHLQIFNKNLTNVIVGVTHLDLDVHRLLKNYREWAILSQHQNLPFFAIDARKEDEISALIEIILARAEVASL